MTKWSLPGLVLLVAVASPERSLAQDPYGMGRFEPEERMNFIGGFDFLSAFYWRGIVQENDNFILQPWFNLTAGGVAGGDFVQNLDIGVQNWNSIELNPGGQSDDWFRSDLLFEFSMDMSDEWKIQPYYGWYKSPENNFNTITELGVNVTFRDEGGWNPSATLAFELEGQADGIAPSGTFLGLGIAPETTAGDDIDISFPIRVGLSLGDYYQNPNNNDEDDFFGYAEAGIDVRIPFEIFPSEYGDWTFNLGLHVLYLGDAAAALNNDTEVELFGYAGVSFVF